MNAYCPANEHIDQRHGPPSCPAGAINPSGHQWREFTLADRWMGRRGGSAWPGCLRFGRRGYSEHRMLLVAGLPCIVPSASAARTSAADAGDSIPILISDDRSSTIPATDGSSVLAGTMVPWRLSHLGIGTRFIVADSIRNLEQEDRVAVMPYRNARTNDFT